MAAVGLPTGPMRRPLSALEGEALQRGLDIVRQLGLDQTYGYSLKPALAAAE